MPQSSDSISDGGTGSGAASRARPLARAPGAPGASAEAERAFTALSARMRPELLRFVTVLVRGDVHRANDLVQDTFLSAWRHLPALRDVEKLRSWLYRVAYRNAMSALRRKGPHGRPMLALDATSEAPDGAVARPTAGAPRRFRVDGAWTASDELAPALASRVAELPAGYLLPIRLHYLERRGLAETASLLGVPIPALKMRLHRARALLKKQLVASEARRRRRAGREAGEAAACRASSPPPPPGELRERAAPLRRRGRGARAAWMAGAMWVAGVASMAEGGPTEARSAWKRAMALRGAPWRQPLAALREARREAGASDPLLGRVWAAEARVLRGAGQTFAAEASEAAAADVGSARDPERLARALVAARSFDDEGDEVAALERLTEVLRGAGPGDGFVYGPALVLRARMAADVGDEVVLAELVKAAAGLGFERVADRLAVMDFAGVVRFRAGDRAGARRVLEEEKRLYADATRRGGDVAKYASRAWLRLALPGLVDGAR